MSSEISDEPEAFNPFEMLSDAPILHIFSFLPGSDLLKLSATDTNFNRIITESSKTMSKIRLVMNFNVDMPLDLDFIIKLAQTRRFTALKLENCQDLAVADVDAEKLVSLLKLLSDSVDDLVIENGIHLELLSLIVAKFLLKLKKFKLIFLFGLHDVPIPIIAESSRQSNVNHRLESLELRCPDVGYVLQLFAGCNHLKTFCCTRSNLPAADIEHLNNFLATQDRLEKLIVPKCGLPWNRLKCFQLKELTVYTLDANDEYAAANFLKKLPKLMKLEFSLRLSRPLMAAICGIPKLEKLTLRSSQNSGGTGDMLERLENRTVKKLHIHDCSTGMTASLLKIFLVTESVFLGVDTLHDLSNVLDLSDVPPETIRKLKSYKEDYCYYKSVVMISPRDIPESVEQFESALLKFAEEFSTDIKGIEIGHASWRNSGDFRLSNSFCEGLVNRLLELKKLEIYNIEDRRRFKTFLCENEDRLNLEDVKLHEPFVVGEPQPKKMKIQFD